MFTLDNPYALHTSHEQVRGPNVHHARAGLPTAERQKEAVSRIVCTGGAIGAARGRFHCARHHLEGDRPDSQGGWCPQGLLLFGLPSRKSPTLSFEARLLVKCGQPFSYAALMCCLYGYELHLVNESRAVSLSATLVL